MFNLTTNLLDDPILVDTCPSFSGGQHSYGAPAALAPTSAAELLNVDIADGMACTRRGTAPVGTSLSGPVRALAWYHQPGGGYLVAAAGGGLYRLDEASWTLLAPLAAGEGNHPLRVAQLGTRLLLADGSAPLRQWDGTDLQTLPNRSNGCPPAGSLILASGGRLWIAGNQEAPDFLYCWQPGEGGGWTAEGGALRIGSEGGAITAVVGWGEEQLVVFKGASAFVVEIAQRKLLTPDGNFRLALAPVTQVSDTLGCVAPGAALRVGKDVWFLSGNGVHSLGRLVAESQHAVKEALSRPVHDIIERINWNCVATSAAVCWGEYFLLSLPLDDATLPNHLLVYHRQQGAWSGLWSGWEALCWAGVGTAPARLLFGRADGSVRQWLDFTLRENEVESTYTDAGANIETRIVSRAMVLGEPHREKSALGIEVEYFASQGEAHLTASLDEDEPLTLGAQFATDAGRAHLPLELPARLPRRGLKRQFLGAQALPPFRTLQAVVNCTAQKLSVRSLTLSGFANALRL